MAASLNFIIFVLLHAILLTSTVHSDDEDENTLLQGINSYRTSLNLPSLNKNKKAGCLADEVADKLEDQPCTTATLSTATQMNRYSESLDKCGIDVNRTGDGIVLPVCVRGLVPTLVLTNYTHSTYSRYINDSRFTGAGLGSEDNWMVVVLSTNNPGGDFAGACRLVSGQSLVGLLLGILVGFVVN